MMTVKYYGMDPMAFKELCKKNGLFVLCAHVSQPVPSSDNWDKTMAWWDVCIDAHFAAGCKFLVQPSMGGDAYKDINVLKKYCDYFNKYHGRFELWHIKDKEEIGASGLMDFAAIWGAAKQSGMQYGVVEVERYNFDEYASCKKSIDFLNAAP